MKALVIAAGRGSRLGPLTYKRPKALVEVLGSSLVERIISALKKAEVSELIIVVGYLGHKIIDALGDGSKHGVRIEYIMNPDWELENGLSVLKAKDKFANEEKFLLVMSDHLFDHKLLTEFIDRDMGVDECVLCVDEDLNRVHDLSGATKVKLGGGRILSIGKNLNDFNGVDCGIFLCSKAIFGALEESMESGHYSLSAGVEILSRKGLMRYMLVNGHFWFDVDTISDLRKLKTYLSSDEGAARRAFMGGDEDEGKF